jgi:hypothetical protein
MDEQLVTLLEAQSVTVSALCQTAANLKKHSERSSQHFVFGYNTTASKCMYPEGLLPHSIWVPVSQATKYPDLVGIPSSILCSRAAALQHYNIVACATMRLQQTRKCLQWTGLSQILAVPHCLMAITKHRVLTAAIQHLQSRENFLRQLDLSGLVNETNPNQEIVVQATEKLRLCSVLPHSVLVVSRGVAYKYEQRQMAIHLCHLSNFKATQSEEGGNLGVATSQNIFVQLYEAWNTLLPEALRSGGDKSKSRLFDTACEVSSILFEGEEGIDDGGVYREGMMRAIESLFSQNFDLLEVSSNAAARRDGAPSFLPNSQRIDERSISMLEFVGRWMALSMRTASALPFEWPQFVYKYVLSGRLLLEDIAEVDTATFEYLQRLLNCENAVDHQGQRSSPSCRMKHSSKPFRALKGL